MRYLDVSNIRVKGLQKLVRHVGKESDNFDRELCIQLHVQHYVCHDRKASMAVLTVGRYAVLYGFTPELFATKDRGTGNALAASANRSKSCIHLDLSLLLTFFSLWYYGSYYCYVCKP